MADSGYLPPRSKWARVAPTEVVNGAPYRGVVHDPTARHMGGVAGHAGLFTTAADLARQVRAGGTETFDAHDIEEIARLLETRLAAGDVLATLGAGDICCKRLNLRIDHGFFERL